MTSLRTRLAHVRASDAMHRGVLTCAPDTPVGEVARVMAQHRVHCVVVQEPGVHSAEAWSVVSDRDLMRAMAGDGADDLVAARVAGTAVPRIGAAEPLTRAAQLMGEHGVSHLVVVGDASGRPEGILSSLDVAMVIAGTG
jgi:crotonyl-CoA carboxylase/reductase